MDVDNISGTSGEDSLTTMESGVASDALAKLRRLKIQESILTASLNKCDFDQNDLVLPHLPDWKIYSAKVRNNINDIKNMFEDIKIATCDSEDNLNTIDIKEVEKDVLNLNDKIKSLEDFISTELKSLKLYEEELITQMNEEIKLEVKIKGKSKIQSKQYNEVVPSPVRVLINSPLKCTEVQQFQDFMSKSKNRYGGWNEYNHNTFVQIWNKFYASDNIVCLENNMKEISSNKLLSQFKNEVIEKISGIQSDDIILHSKWYSEFCCRKLAQQEALNKWKDNKIKIKGRQGKVKSNKIITSNTIDEKLCKKQNDFYKYQKTKLKDCCSNLIEIHARPRSSQSVGHFEEHEYNKNESQINENNNTASMGSLPSSEELFSSIQKGSNPRLAEPHEYLIIPKLKSRMTFASPTKQWINRCNGNGADEATRYFNSNNIESVNKLWIPNWRLSLQKY